MRIKEITSTRVHNAYRRVHVLLQREGWEDNHKRVYRLYRNEGLSLCHKRPKRNRSARLQQPKQLVSAINEIQSTNFIADALFDGSRLRALIVVDNYTGECLAIEVGQSLKKKGGPCECLNEHWVLSFVDAQCKIEAWRRHYNETRTYTALNWPTPEEFSIQERKREELKHHQESEISMTRRFE